MLKAWQRHRLEPIVHVSGWFKLKGNKYVKTKDRSTETPVFGWFSWTYGRFSGGSCRFKPSPCQPIIDRWRFGGRDDASREAWRARVALY
jgi:hypothetical protein